MNKFGTNTCLTGPDAIIFFEFSRVEQLFLEFVLYVGRCDNHNFFLDIYAFVVASHGFAHVDGGACFA